jgi:hypothetical protein
MANVGESSKDGYGSKRVNNELERMWKEAVLA